MSLFGGGLAPWVLEAPTGTSSSLRAVSVLDFRVQRFQGTEVLIAAANDHFTNVMIQKRGCRNIKFQHARIDLIC